MCVSYIAKTLFCLDYNVIYRENNTFLYIDAFSLFCPEVFLYMDNSNTFSYILPRFSLYIETLCIFLYRHLFLFYLAQIPHIQCVFRIYSYNTLFFFSLFCPEMCISLYSFSYRYFLYITKDTSFLFYFPQKINGFLYMQ